MTLIRIISNALTNLRFRFSYYCFEMSDPEIQTGCMNNKDGNF